MNWRKKNHTIMQNDSPCDLRNISLLLITSRCFLYLFIQKVASCWVVGLNKGTGRTKIKWILRIIQLTLQRRLPSSPSDKKSEIHDDNNNNMEEKTSMIGRPAIWIFCQHVNYKSFSTSNEISKPNYLKNSIKIKIKCLKNI